MTRRPASNLKQTTVMLSNEQVDRIRSIQQERETDWHNVSFGLVLREVVEAGLTSFEHVRSSNISASHDNVPQLSEVAS